MSGPPGPVGGLDWRSAGPQENFVAGRVDAVCCCFYGKPPVHLPGARDSLHEARHPLIDNVENNDELGADARNGSDLCNLQG